MKIALGCDHGGFPLKETALKTILLAGHEVLDLGTFTADP
ncbi:MAG: ribose-5-phosphate isomerase, partial [Lysobacteraceae bacterium]